MIRRLAGVAAIAVAVAVSPPVTGAFAQSFKGYCTVVAGAISGRRFATLKCYKESDPGNYVIRSTVWERDDAAEYRKLAGISGRRFSCTMTPSGSRVSDDALIGQLKLSDCR